MKDINNLSGGGSNPINWSAVNDDLFIFQANNPLNGQSLFASDGTESGTIGLGIYQVDTKIIQFKDRAFFGGCNLLLGVDSCASLYISDGTMEGTNFFFDFIPNSVSLGIEDIVAGDSLFYFSGHIIESGFELWRSNGTPEGTYQIADIATGTNSGYSGELAVIDDIAYFAGYTEATGIEPWRSDGTAIGTYMITDLNDGTASGFPSGFTASGGYIYFSGLGTGSGVEVRRTSGEAGNIELIGEMGTTDSSNPRDFVDSDGILYYVAEGNDAAGFDLFVYDHVGAPVHLEMPNGDIFPRALLPFGDGEVVFNAEDGAGRELWRSDGTIAGTHMIIDLYPGVDDGVFGPGSPDQSYYVCNDSLVYFAGADGVNAAGEFVYELFESDGTADGTKLVVDQFPGPEGSNPGNFFEFGNRLYYSATDPSVGREPYYLDKGIINSIITNSNNFSIQKAPYPNPCPSGTLINSEINLLEGSNVYIQLYNLMGVPVIKDRHLGYLSAGTHKLQIDLPNHRGIYKLELKAKDGISSFLILLE